MVNSHFVPKQTLRKFADKICLYNIKTGEYRENVKIDKAFSQVGFYDDETEKNLNEKIESQFGSLFANKLNLCESTIELNRTELKQIKKFLLISVIRSLGSEQFLQVERKFYDNKKLYWKNFCKANGASQQEYENGIKSMTAPFIEKVIEGETPWQYWMRTLNVILDTDGTPASILQHPNKTYPAHRWAQVIATGYVAFWDADFIRDEFVITDIGMTSENEVGWNGITIHNFKKTTFLIDLLKKENDSQMKTVLEDLLIRHTNFTENFMMFPISSKRMIVEITPFYKFRQMYKDYYSMPALSYLTKLNNERLFYPNDAIYVLPQNSAVTPNYHPDDKYVYEIKKLSRAETRYCNELFLDRINTWVGFSSLNKAVGSIVKYKKDNSYPFVPRVDYTALYKVIENRYGGNLNV